MQLTRPPADASQNRTLEVAPTPSMVEDDSTKDEKNPMVLLLKSMVFTPLGPLSSLTGEMGCEGETLSALVQKTAGLEAEPANRAESDTGEMFWISAGCEIG